MNETIENKGLIYEFGKFMLDPQERTLLVEGKPVHLTDKVFDTLLFLLENNGRLLTKDEMMAAIWQESFVEESNLAKNISRLRKILNADGLSRIETLPKRGYRFRADVKQINGETNLLIHRSLRVKITHTVESDEEKENVSLVKILASPPPRLPASLALAFSILLIVIISVLGFYFWKREKSVLNTEAGAIRLTDNQKHDNHPAWTKDGRIRFLRYGKDKQVESVVMNADGTNQTTVKDFANLEYGFWSPDGKKVVFAKQNDKTAFYLANSDGANEIALPFYGGNFDWSPDSRKIVHQKNVSPENPDIFVYSLDTGKSENISNNPAFDADPAFSPDGNQIVFVSRRDGNVEIYLMNANGGDVQRLTNHPAWDNHPVFSPDGTTIVFNSDRENEIGHIYLMNVDGNNIRRLTDWQTDETIEPSCWSPDGTKIAFTSYRNGDDDIYVVSAEIYHPQLVLADDASNLQNPSLSPDGKQIVYQAEMPDKSGELRVFNTETKKSRVILKTKNADIAPTLSPDGTRIAFQNKIESNTEICLINADGSNLTNLTNNTARDVYPTFSPDGKHLAFASNRDGNFGVYNLFVMDADGSNPRRIYNKESIIFTPAWSPDARQIIFAKDAEGHGNFEILSIETEMDKSEKRLTFRPQVDAQPVFSPDGKLIAFSSNSDGNYEIYLMNADGSGLLRLTRNLFDDGTPQFSGDGERIIFSSNRNGKFALYEIELVYKNE